MLIIFLGNMVVSSMIEDYGLVPSAYIMCNSAVPIEAFDPAIESTNVLVHSEWVDYPTNTWSKSWYSLFPANDARSKLTWRETANLSVEGKVLARLKWDIKKSEKRTRMCPNFSRSLNAQKALSKVITRKLSLSRYHTS